MLTTPINAVATTQEMVPIPQDVLQSPLDELNDLTVENSKVSSDPLVHTFAHQIWHFSNELIRKLQKWSSLDESLIRELKSGTSTSFLELEIVDQLAELLLNEFGQSLAERDIAWTNRIRECCQQVRALLNELMDRPPDARLKTALDSPTTRQELTTEFDRALHSPVRQMINGIEQLLTDSQLSSVQYSIGAIAVRN